MALVLGLRLVRLGQPGDQISMGLMSPSRGGRWRNTMGRLQPVLQVLVRRGHPGALVPWCPGEWGEAAPLGEHGV